MKRLVFTDVERYEYDEVPDLRAEGERAVLVDVKAVGICGTDLHIFAGSRKVTFPLVAGHEAVGIVREVGPAVTKVKPGDYVTMEPNFMCRRCSFCMGGHNNLCHAKRTLGLSVDGVFQSQVVADEEYVWKLPSDMSLEEGIIVETATVALCGVNKAGLRLGDRVFVAGAGTVGLLTMQLAKLSGAVVTIFDLEESRLRLAKELGADYTCGANTPLPEGIDVAFDCAGVGPTINTCLRVVKNGGSLISIGIAGKPVEIDMMDVTRRELSIKGSVACTVEFPTAIELIASGKLNAKALVTRTLPFEKLVEGIELMEKKEAIKVAVTL